MSFGFSSNGGGGGGSVQLTGYDREADLGNINGFVSIDLRNQAGQPLDVIKANLDGGIEVEFSNLPPKDLQQSFVLEFTGVEEILWPSNTLYPNGEQKDDEIEGTYQIVCSIDSDGVLTIYDVINDIKEAE